MLHTTNPSISPVELAAAAFTLPLFSLGLASLILAVILLAPRLLTQRAQPAQRAVTGTHPGTARYQLELRVLGIGAIAVTAAFAVENVVRGYLLNLVDVVEWWQYATPVFAAFLCLSVVLGVMAFKGSAPPEQPVVPTARRTWTSFGPRTGIIGAGAALVALLTTTIAAGLASSADDRGRYIYVELPVPNVPIDALRPWFYGWAYGVPVIISLAALTAVTWATLRRNSTRPFQRPSTVGQERTARVEIASSAARIATAGMLLALAGAFRFIGRSGSISSVTTEIDGQSTSYEMTWRFAEFAAAASYLAPVLEITAFLLLLLVASRTLIPAQALKHPTQSLEHSSDPEPVR